MNDKYLIKPSKNKKELSPQTKLWQSVLSLACEEALENRNRYTFARYGIRGYKYKKGEIRRLKNKAPYLKLLSEIDEARVWFKETGKHFKFVCTSADCDYEAVHERMIKNIKKAEKQEN
jgi:hypothetical protein